MLLLLALGLEFLSEEFASSMKRQCPQRGGGLRAERHARFRRRLASRVGVRGLFGTGRHHLDLVVRNRRECLEPESPCNRETPAVLSILVPRTSPWRHTRPDRSTACRWWCAGRRSRRSVGHRGGRDHLLAHRAEAIAERVINHEDDEQVLLRVWA